MRYLITTFAILWFCKSPQGWGETLILTIIIGILASFGPTYYYVNNEDGEENENDNQN